MLTLLVGMERALPLFWWLLEELDVILSYDLKLLLLVIHPSELETCSQKFLCVFMAVIFIIPPKWK